MPGTDHTSKAPVPPVHDSAQGTKAKTNYWESVMSVTNMFQAIVQGGGKFYNWYSGRETDIDSSIHIKEITALIRYAAENGIDPPGPDPQTPEKTTVTLLNDALNRYEILNAMPSRGEQELQAMAELKSAMLYHYTRLARSTQANGHQVNGRTLIDTRNSGRALLLLTITTIVLATVAVVNEMFVSWIYDQMKLETVQQAVFFPKAYFVKEHVLQHLMPFVWGALGGCIYLSMRLYDIASNRAFDRNKFHGWVLRVLLASIIGAVTFYIISPAAITPEGVPIEAKTLAFLAGLGVKVIYGAFEKLVDAIVEKFNLDSLRRAPSDAAKVREYFALQLSDPKIADDPKKRDAIIGMMKELGVKA